jgi:septum site-determining protein MinC
MVVRGTAAGLEFVFGEGSFDETSAEVYRRLAERPEFYRGSKAAAIFTGSPPDYEVFSRFVERVAGHGVALRGLYGSDEVAAFAERNALEFLGAPRPSALAVLERKRVAAAEEALELSERARSLDADFAGARTDLARRRKSRGKRGALPAALPAAPAPAAPLAAVPERPATLYHRGTLRGGQALQQVGNIVVVGDVNPGAELIASGDIVVFGSLRGTAHAGAQGDPKARVIALELTPTQLRIATYIAAGGDPARREREPEEAFIDGDRIAIAPLGRAPR